MPSAMPLAYDTYDANRQTSFPRRRSVGFAPPPDIGRPRRPSMSYGSPPELDVSRRQSLGYGKSQVAFPYDLDTHRRGYGEPMTAPMRISGLPGENYPQQSFQIYAPPKHHRQSHVFDGLDLSIPGSHYPQNGQSSYYPSTPHLNMPPKGNRQRHSSMSYPSRPTYIEGSQRLRSTRVKFKRKGGMRSGIDLGEAQGNVRLSGNDLYTFHDLHTDDRRRIHLVVQWGSYQPLTYEIPLDGYDGLVDLQALARRTARAVIHYLQENSVPIHWNRVELHHLEEVSFGKWQPVLSAH